MGLGRFGFAGGLGVLVRGWPGSLGDFDLGPKLTRGFHLNGPGAGYPHWDVPRVAKPGSASGEGRKIPTPKLTGIVGSCDGYGWFGCRWGSSGSPTGLMDPHVIWVQKSMASIKTDMFSEKRDVPLQRVHVRDRFAEVQ